MENVLDSVVESLLRDPNRKFVFAEMVSSLNCVRGFRVYLMCCCIMVSV